MLRRLLLVAVLVLAPGSALAQISISVSASRGTNPGGTDVAPLGVFFDAKDTSWSGKNATAVWRDLEFRWDFGDPGAGRWTRGNQSGDAGDRNIAFGPTAAHVFESPGSYTVRVTATDPVSGASAQKTLSIQVDDPNQVFSADSTICYSTAASESSWSGCPAGATHKTGADWSTVVRDAAPGRRLLLKRGQNFGSGGTFPGLNGPGHLGAFGSGAKPVVTQGGVKISIADATDWRYADVVFSGSCGADGVTQDWNGPTEDVLLLRLEMGSCRHAINMASWGAGTNLKDQPHNAFVVDGTFDCPSDNTSCFMFGGVDSAFMGNDVTAHGEDHAMRAPFWQNIIVNHNTVHVKSTACRAGIKLAPETYGNVGSGAGVPARWAIVSDNHVPQSDCESVAFSSDEGSGTAATGEFGILERNYLVNPAYHCITSAMKNAVYRNNICQQSSSEAAGFLIAPWTQGNTPNGWMSGLRVYHNTMVNTSGGSGGGYEAIFLAGGSDTPSSIARNNLLYAPNMSGSPTVVSGAATTSDNNRVQSKIFSSTSGPESYKVDSSNRASVGQASVVAVATDHSGASRLGGAHDVGAWNLGGGSAPPPPVEEPPPPPPPPPPTLPPPPVPPTLLD